ncbi:RidA family protein [Rhodococcus opacus]|uniref:RidA family protein n=1 Tax=Rhodococcus opacus TaxID=37919 RepID=UPI001C461E1B|nr:RidA family protein [Rhodococcus opacus]MBV6761647.1 RidA family protein [Rhodococcus opacus]
MSRFINGEGSDLAQYGLSTGAVAGGLVFAAAMALDSTTMSRDDAAASIADETRICLELLENALKEGGCTLGDIVKINCYLSEDSYRSEFWQTYDEIFAPIGNHAVRITQVVGVACGCRVELDAIAVAPNGD